jgi:hypothetical protein
MKAKAAFYFLILCQQLLSLERYRRKKGVEVKVHCRFTVYCYLPIHKKQENLYPTQLGEYIGFMVPDSQLLFVESMRSI